MADEPISDCLKSYGREYSDCRTVAQIFQTLEGNLSKDEKEVIIALLNGIVQRKECYYCEQSRKSPPTTNDEVVHESRRMDIAWSLVKVLNFALLNDEDDLFVTWIEKNFRALQTYCAFGESMLHTAVRSQFNGDPCLKDPSPIFPSLPLLKVLVTKVEVNWKSASKETPLHLISQRLWEVRNPACNTGTADESKLEVLRSMARLLVDHGASLEVECDRGIQAGYGLASMWPEFRVTVPTLQTLVARYVVANRVPHDGNLPQNVLHLLKLHDGAKKSKEQMSELRQRRYEDKLDKEHRVKVALRSLFFKKR